MMLLCYIILISAIVGDTLEDDITPTSPEEYYLEGGRVKISCNYTVKDNNLQWYRQYPGSAPQFLLCTTVTSKSSTRVDLMISSVELEDSALYHCALQPTVTGNPDTLYKNLSRPLGMNSALVETLCSAQSVIFKVH
uniref:Ig-like domain-containing protein n=1 Tax=Salmo trutta TaxID=8032 RepID=A0A674BFG3_SALTR